MVPTGRQRKRSSLCSQRAKRFQFFWTIVLKCPVAGQRNNGHSNWVMHLAAKVVTHSCLASLLDAAGLFCLRTLVLSPTTIPLATHSYLFFYWQKAQFPINYSTFTKNRWLIFSFAETVAFLTVEWANFVAAASDASGSFAGDGGAAQCSKAIEQLY